MSILTEQPARKITPSWLVTATKDRDLALIVAFCAIGLLISLSVMLRVPDFGTIIGQLN